MLRAVLYLSFFFFFNSPRRRRSCSLSFTAERGHLLRNYSLEECRQQLTVEFYFDHHYAGAQGDRLRDERNRKRACGKVVAKMMTTPPNVNRSSSDLLFRRRLRRIAVGAFSTLGSRTRDADGLLSIHHGSDAADEGATPGTHRLIRRAGERETAERKENAWNEKNRWRQRKAHCGKVAQYKNRPSVFYDSNAAPLRRAVGCCIIHSDSLYARTMKTQKIQAPE